LDLKDLKDLNDLNSDSGAVRLKAAEGLAALGWQAKGASAVLCYRLIYDQSRVIRIVALDALESVNPTLHQPVSVLAAPLTEVDLRLLGTSGRGMAVAQLAALGPEGKAATGVLIAYKLQISQPGGWQHVPQVIEALVKVAPDDSTVTASLVQWLSRDLSPDSRVAAATALAWMRDGKNGVGASAAAVRVDREERVRLAVRALGALGRDARLAIPDLTNAKTDPSEKVREAAREALALIQKLPAQFRGADLESE
jgi:hypothetical protein